jgi:hypothetical protein
LVVVVAEIGVRHLIVGQDMMVVLAVVAVLAQELLLAALQHLIQAQRNKVILVVLRPDPQTIVVEAVALEELEQQHLQLVVEMAEQDILGRTLV